MKGFFDNATGIVMFFLFLLAQFPGGTVFMAMRCESIDLTGWNWVLSVVMPFYGLIHGLTC